MTKHKNVFILCTGRSGSTTLAKACSHITNYSSGHETRASEIGESRLNYADNHIEADNRLSWMLGSLDKKYGDDAFYVHLIREKESLVKSFGNRWSYSSSILQFLAKGVYSLAPELLGEAQKQTICEDYFDIINSNIELFLRDKSNKMVMQLETIEADFEDFWNQIDAQGDFELAKQELSNSHNATKDQGEVVKKERAYQIDLERKILTKQLSEASGFSDRLGFRIRLFALKLSSLLS